MMSMGVEGYILLSTILMSGAVGDLFVEIIPTPIVRLFIARVKALAGAFCSF